MGNGEWGMENGERRMDGEFIVASLIPFITSHWSCAEIFSFRIPAPDPLAFDLLKSTCRWISVVASLISHRLITAPVGCLQTGRSSSGHVSKIVSWGLIAGWVGPNRWGPIATSEVQ
jgi:hypothetical protein